MTLQPAHRPPNPADVCVTTDIELCTFWEDLMGPGGFGRRSLWLAMFDADGRVSPLLMPVDDIPLEPTRMLSKFASLVELAVCESGSASAAILLSRPGPAEMTDRDRRWARGLVAECRGVVDLWPVHLATKDQVRVFAPDDLAGG